MLENERVVLRALEPGDVDILYLWENDPNNWRISHTLTPYSKKTLSDYIHSITDIYTDKQLRLIIQSKTGRTALGSVDLFDCDFKNKRAGIGILIADAAHRSAGIGTEVLSLMMDYCFHTLDLHQVYCNVLTDNNASLRLFEKFGFIQAGLKRDWVYHQGQFMDELLLQKIRDNG